MASTITNYSNQINIGFPVAGQDNDSQGFRTNFTKIQTALSVADDEITNLQLNAVNLSATNDFGTNVIKRAALQNSSLVVNDGGSVAGAVNVNYALGSYQQFSVSSGTYLFTVINWPPVSAQCGTIRLELTPTTADGVIVDFGAASVVNVGTTPLPATYTQTTPMLWDLWSPDQGNTVYANAASKSETTVSLKHYKASELIALGVVPDGTLVFATDESAPAYYYGGDWYKLVGSVI